MVPFVAAFLISDSHQSPSQFTGCSSASSYFAVRKLPAKKIQFKFITTPFRSPLSRAVSVYLLENSTTIRSSLIGRRETSAARRRRYLPQDLDSCIHSHLFHQVFHRSENHGAPKTVVIRKNLRFL